MSTNTVRLERVFPTDSKNLFVYFIQSNLLEKWMATADMAAKFLDLNPVAGGNYHYEFMTKKGKWSCEGKFAEIKPYKSIVTWDRTLPEPNTTTITNAIGSKFEFTPCLGGTRISLIQTGFLTSEAATTSEMLWHQRMSLLMVLIDEEKNVEKEWTYA